MSSSSLLTLLDVSHGCFTGDVLLDLLSFEFDTAIATGASDTGYIGQWDGDVKSGHGMETTEVGVGSSTLHLLSFSSPFSLFPVIDHESPAS